MRSLHTLVVLALVPSLIARTESVSELLHTPERGQASLTFSDGTRSEGTILRVTDQFVTFQLARGVCENVELSRIAGIEWSPEKQSVSDTIDGVSTLLFAVPFVVAFLIPSSLYAVAHRVSHPTDPIWGNWESIQDQIPRRTEIDRIQFMPNNRNATTQDPGYVRRMKVVIEEGTYQADTGSLYITQLGKGLDGLIPFRFKCDVLVAAASARVHKLKPSGVQPHTASPPVVGEWIELWDGVPTTWEFKPDGVLQIKRIERSDNGRFTKSKKSVKATFPGLASEEWDVRVESGRLFVSSGGKLTEYQKGPPTR
jgi:hypothetical protein